MTPEKNTNVKDTVFYNLSFFHSDQEILLLYQKIERICGAIFLITRLVEDGQNIKKTLQDSAVMSFKECVELVASVDITSQKLKKVSFSLMSLYSYLDNAFWSGILSQMNAAVVQKEIRFSVDLISRIEERYKNSSNPTNSFLTLLEKSTVPSGHSNMPIKDRQSAVKDTQKDVLKDNIKDTGNNGHGSGEVSYPRENNEQRIAKIRALLRDFKPRTIKDISALFPEVSEKTIQREVNRLIGQGMVKRMGDRRWSTYILIA